MFQNGNFNQNQFNNFNMNPAFQQAFNNMGQNNQNYNPMELNYYLMQMMLMNPFIFQMNNNSNQNFMFMQSSNNNNGLQNLGILPRPNQTSNLMDNQDSFPGMQGPRINITFETSTGITKNISTPLEVKLKDLFTKFAQKVGVNVGLVFNKIIFIVNGLSIKKEDLNKTVKQYFQDGYSRFQVKIIVIDQSNIIGA